ncbi:hypothetical protein IMZ48_40785, partial [Candidatus Bathyarchaeota archaeon]|nr:hypothetical protein [Candidatus Bathyarchaeota archaeon]
MTAFQLTNAHTDYAPIPETTPPLFTQPAYSLKLLQAILKANNALLSTLPLQGDYSKITHLSQLGATATLADLAGSCREMDHAWPTLSTLWAELTNVPGRPPVLFTLDGLAHVMRDSEYHDTAFNRVHAHQLTVVRLFTEALSGKTSFPNGAAILSTSGGNDNVKLPSV